MRSDISDPGSAADAANHQWQIANAVFSSLTPGPSPAARGATLPFAGDFRSKLIILVRISQILAAQLLPLF
jgi:hypothetical protein